MADVTNLEKFLTDVASSIREKKGTTEKLSAETFDTEIDSIPTGTVVEKIVTEADKIVEEEEVVKIETTPIETPVVIPENGKAEVLAEKTVLAESIGLTPDKIVKGSSILGVDGEAEGGSAEVNNQDKIITENGIYTADEGYTGLGNVTVSVQGGSGDIKIFPSVEAMHADTSSTDGDKAIVYNYKTEPFAQDLVSSVLYFPDTVVLDEAQSSTSSGYLINTDKDSASSHSIYLSSTYFYIRDNGGSGYIVRYSSSDGITYTRQSSYSDTYEVPYKLQASSGWKDVFSKFIYARMYSFEGFYKYSISGRKDALRYINLDDTTVNVTNRTIVWNGNYNDEIISHKKLLKAFNDVVLPEYPTAKINYCGTFMTSDNELCIFIWLNEDGTIMSSAETNVIVNESNEAVGISSHYYLSSYDRKIKMWKIYEDSYSTPEILSRNANGYISYIPKTVPFVLSNTGWTLSSIRYYYLPISSTNYINRTQAALGYNLTPDGYSSMPNQFTLSNPNQLLPDVIALGMNGEVIGDGTVYDKLDWNYLLEKKFNLTPTYENGTTKRYDTMPTRYMTNQWNAQKQIYLKTINTCDIPNKYVSKVQNFTKKLLPLISGNTTLNQAKYHKQSNTWSSIQYNSTTDTYTFYIQNYDTGTVLHSEVIAASGNRPLSIAGNNVIREDYTVGSTSVSGKIYIYSYDLSTCTKSTILSYTSSNQITDFDTIGIEDKYFIYSYSYASSYSSSGTCYYKTFIFDGTNNTTKSIYESSMSSSTYTPTNYLRACNMDNKIYIICGIGRNSTKWSYSLRSYDKSARIVTTIGSTTSSIDTVDTQYKGGYEDDNYIYFEEDVVSKSSTLTVYDLYATLLDVDGNTLEQFSRGPATLLEINGELYVYCRLSAVLAKVNSYTITDGNSASEKDLTCICSNFYPMSHQKSYYDEQSKSYTLNIDCASLKINGDGTYYFDAIPIPRHSNDNGQTSFGLLTYPCIESTSIDYNFSVLNVGSSGTQVFVQSNADYAGCITQEEYDEINAMAEGILGGVE